MAEEEEDSIKYDSKEKEIYESIFDIDFSKIYLPENIDIDNGR